MKKMVMSAFLIYFYYFWSTLSTSTEFTSFVVCWFPRYSTLPTVQIALQTTQTTTLQTIQISDHAKFSRQEFGLSDI